MSWVFQDGRPIYLQLAEKLSERIISGDYLLGEMMPSVRDIASEAAVNPNTVQKALAELKEKGLIETKGTLGSFVFNDSSRLKEIKRDIAKETVMSAIKKLRDLHIGDDDIATAFNNYIKEEKK